MNTSFLFLASRNKCFKDEPEIPLLKCLIISALPKIFFNTKVNGVL